MGAIRRLPGDEKGNFLVFFGLSVAVLLGTVALSFDLGRLAATQSELQSFADSVALAAAAELDGSPTSVDRARNAAVAMIQDRQTFATDGQTLNSTDFRLTFLSALPSDDSTIDPATNVVCRDAACDGLSAANAYRATMVRVDVIPHTVPFIFASVLRLTGADAPSEGSTMATATAGFTQFACDITPMFFCVPRNTGAGGEDLGPGSLSVGQMVHMRSGGGSGAWGPGNFGFLDISALYDPDGACKGEKGADIIRCLLGATDTITRCFPTRGVDTDPGNSVGITVNPINFRFDLWGTGDFSKKARDNPIYAPAPNVIYGQEPDIDVKTTGRKAPTTTRVTVDHCSLTSDADPLVEPYAYPAGSAETSIGLPPGAFQAGADGEGRFGLYNTAAPAGEGGTFLPGSDDRMAYMRLNHNWYGTGDPFPDAMTRWEVYLAEIAAAGAGPILPPMEDATGNPVPLQHEDGTPVLRDDGTLVNARQETGRAECAVGSDNEYRRVMVAAGIDCVETIMKGKTKGVPVQSLYEVFLTEPVRDEGGGNLDLYGEIIGIAGGTGSESTESGILHDVVQLYR